jgi:hypothetical protein
MPRKKKTETESKGTELNLEDAVQDSVVAVDPQPVEEISTTKSAEDSAKTDVLTPQPAPELTITQPSEVIVDSSNDAMAHLTNTLNSEFKKSGNGLTAHIAKVSNNIAYVLIKAANSAYCFARIGQAKEASRAALELEFLSNAPSHAHNQISEICKSLNIFDSKRLFFHPSGIL